MAIAAYYEALLRRKVRGAAFSFVGGVFLLIGILFLIAALWMILSEIRDAKFAAIVLGCGSIAVGFITLGVGKLISRVRVVAPVHPVARPGMAGALLPLIEAFVVGIEAARRSRRRPPPRD